MILKVTGTPMRSGDYCQGSG